MKNKMFVVVLLIVIISILFSIGCYAFELKNNVTEEDFFTEFREAEFLYSWFTRYGSYFLQNKPAVAEENIYRPGNGNPMPYLPMPQELSTKELLRGRLLEYFSEDTADVLLASAFEPETGYPEFIYHDGTLYGVMDAQIQTSSPDYYDPERYKYSISEKTDDKIVYRLDKSFPDGSPAVSYDYIAEKNDAGQWIFTKFAYPRTVGNTDMFDNPINPDTSDASIICMSAAALLSAVGAVYVMKKRRAA